MSADALSAALAEQWGIEDDLSAYEFAPSPAILAALREDYLRARDFLIGNDCKVAVMAAHRILTRSPAVLDQLYQDDPATHFEIALGGKWQWLYGESGLALERGEGMGYTVMDGPVEMFTPEPTTPAEQAEWREEWREAEQIMNEKHGPTESVDLLRENKVQREVEKILITQAAHRRVQEIEAENAEPIRVHTRAEMELLPEPEPLWDGWLYSGTPALISAPGGVGKSALILGLGAAMDRGVGYLGSTVRPGKMLYITGEGERALGRRIRAWETHNGVPIGSAQIDVIYGHPLNHGTLKQIAAIVREGQYDVVVGDTVSSLTRLTSENDNSEVSTLIRAWHAAILGANPAACPVLIHHVTEQTDRAGRRKQKSRGASAWRDDHSTVIMLEGTADAFEMSTEQVAAGKQKDAAPRTLSGLALQKAGPHMVVALQTDQERMQHHVEVQRLVGLMVPGNGYTSTELQDMWGLASNKGRYQALRTEALDLGFIAKGDGNKGRYVRQ